MVLTWITLLKVFLTWVLGFIVAFIFDCMDRYIEEDNIFTMLIAIVTGVGTTLVLDRIWGLF